MWQELKKKKGIKEEIQLTTKQKEMMQIQLEKESATRKRLQEVRSSKVCPVNQVIKTDCPPVWHFKIPCLLFAAGWRAAECGGSPGSHSDRETCSDHQGAPCCPPGPNAPAAFPPGCSRHPAGLLGYWSVPHAQEPSTSGYKVCLGVVLKHCFWHLSLKSLLFFFPPSSCPCGSCDFTVTEAWVWSG